MCTILLTRIYFLLITVPLVVPTAEERLNYFNLDLLQAVKEDYDGNVIMSPASAKLALMTLAEGTGGLTRHELLSALRLPEDDSTIRRIANRTLRDLMRDQNGTEVDAATRMWVQQGLRISTSYSTILQRYYSGDLQSVDFRNTQGTANSINDWVRRATREKIQNFVDSSSIHPDTQLFLTSALYFKGSWLKSFSRNRTRMRCFHVPSVGCQNIHFMEVTSKYRFAYVPSLDAKVIEIPYSDRTTSMLIFLPNRKEGGQTLRILAKDLSYIPLSALLAHLEETEVYVSIPKFTIESKLDLRSPLERMGIRNLFDFSANLTGILTENSSRVSNIVQNAKIEVDEEGTIAVAVTGVGIVPLMGSEAEDFQANRPFIFMIVDLNTNGTLFSGWVINPDANNLRINN